MNTVSEAYLARAEMWLLITTLVYFTMNGAQLFETAVIVPKWTASPPVSFHLLQGTYGLDLKAFWILIHSIHEITFITAIIVCWELDTVRNWLLGLFAIHFAVRVWTVLYFAPRIIGFQKTDVLNQQNAQLRQQATSWKNLNYLRVALFVAVSVGLIPVCSQLLHWKQ